MTATPRVPTDRHIPALDGVRGLAISLVLMFHFTHWSEGPSQWLRTGWVGVDLFFVLSGFLITGLLLDTRDASNYFRSFYARRSLRIFPLYFGVLFAVFVVGPWIGLGQLPGFHQLTDKQAWFWTYTSNFYVSITGRFDLHASWLDLTHFWSLAVEEHFYLIWPAVVLLSRRNLIRACWGCVIIATLCRVAMIVVWTRPVGSYFLTFCRLDSLAIGGLVATMARRPSGLPGLKRDATIMAIVGSAIVIALGLRSGRFAAADRLIQMIGFPALGFAFAGLIVFASLAHRGGFWHRVWTCPPLTTLGRYSYGIYVYHQLFGRKLVEVIAPHLRWAGPFGASVGMIGVGLAVNLGVAMLSYHLFEARFLRLKSRFAAKSTRDMALTLRSSASAVPA